LISFYRVLVPNAKLRLLVVPQGPEVQAQAGEVAVADECQVETVQARSHRISWARLPKRVFDIDMQHCPNCGGEELKIIATILERCGNTRSAEFPLPPGGMRANCTPIPSGRLPALESTTSRPKPRLSDVQGERPCSAHCA
jgi:hypothetical protein